MKFLLLVVAAFVAVNSSPVPDSDELKQVAQNVLDIAKILQTEIDDALKTTKEVRAVSAKIFEKIPSTVAENEDIIELKKTLKEAAIEKCQEVFDSKIKSFNANLTENLTETVEMQVTVLDSTLNLIKEQLRQIDDALTNNLDKEIEACQKDISSCRINGEFIDITDSVFGLIGTSQITVSKSAESALSKIEYEVIDDKIENAVLTPVKECLKESA